MDLDSQARLEMIARVVLPIFADACAVYLPVAGDQIRLAAFASADDGAEADFDPVTDHRPIRSTRGAAVGGHADREAAALRAGAARGARHARREAEDSERFVPRARSSRSWSRRCRVPTARSA